jgi:hypothetical protein
MEIRWGMFDEPRDADEQREKYEDDQDPKCDGGVLPPRDPSNAFSRPAIHLSGARSGGVRTFSTQVVTNGRHVGAWNARQVSCMRRRLSNEWFTHRRRREYWSGERSRSKLEESLAKDTRLQTADLELLTSA